MNKPFNFQYVTTHQEYYLEGLEELELLTKE